MTIPCSLLSKIQDHGKFGTGLASLIYFQITSAGKLKLTIKTFRNRKWCLDDSET